MTDFVVAHEFDSVELVKQEIAEWAQLAMQLKSGNGIDPDHDHVVFRCGLLIGIECLRLIEYLRFIEYLRLKNKHI